MRNLILDTHIFIWLLNGDTTIQPKIRKIIANALLEGSVYLSAISCWEIAMLEKRNRIVLTKPCLEWINDSLSRSGIQILELSPEISVESCQLPDFSHGDPADRIIIASARHINANLITRDQTMITYGKKHYVNIIPA